MPDESAPNYNFPGSVINGTTNYPNAYDAASSADFDADNGLTLSPEMKTFYDTVLLDNARVDMKYAQFGTKVRLPKHHGKTVEWRRPNTFARAGQLTEGVIPTGQKFGWSTVTGTVNQFGTFAAATDQLELHAYDDNIKIMAEEMAASAAETQEYLIRNALLANTNVLYCDNVDPEDGYLNTPTACNRLCVGGSSTVGTGENAVTVKNGYAYLTPDMVAKAATKMRKDKVPTINGKYYAVIHPSVAYDLRKSDEWVDVHKYASPEEIYSGEIGELHGVRFIEDNFAPVLRGDYKNKANTSTYATYFFGKDAFKTIDPEGGALQMIIKTKEQIGGPLEQFGTVGYKFETNGATVVSPERVLRVMSTSSYSGTDSAN